MGCGNITIWDPVESFTVFRNGVEGDITFSILQGDKSGGIPYVTFTLPENSDSWTGYINPENMNGDWLTLSVDGKIVDTSFFQGGDSFDPLDLN
jgi:hypothetical protein